MVTPGPVQDNLKETTDKDYPVGWQVSQHTGTITLNQQLKADLYEEVSKYCQEEKWGNLLWFINVYVNLKILM